VKVIKKLNSVIIVLHEIYGINQHIETVCEKFSEVGYDIICPNLIDRRQPFNYDQQEEAYQHFINNIGFDLGSQQVKQLIIQAKTQYSHVFLLGYSIGATITWMCSDEESMCDGIIGYYGSRIRDFKDITPKCPTLLIFSNEEKSFNVNKSGDFFKKKNVDIHILSGKHGFSDAFSENYFPKSFEEAGRLVDSFIKKIILSIN